MITLNGLKILLFGSKRAKIITLCVAVALGVWGYGQYKYLQGGAQNTVKIIKKSNKVAKKRSKGISKRRARVKPVVARKRLRDYARPASN